VVSTPAGVNGLDLVPGEDFLLAETPEEIAAAIARLFSDPEDRRRIEDAARSRVEREFGWDSIARRQAMLYRQVARE
jgi:glycosyltransferase involved in cell wall biosynthesis